MRIRYNSPVVLTYTFICVIVLAISEYFLGDTFRSFFTVYGEFGSIYNPLSYFRLISHAAGHANWPHLVGNFSIILLIGPILEEKYGSGRLLFMIVLTAFITGLLNIFFFSSGLLGASGIVFMMIILSSISNVKGGSIPLTFILVGALYIGTEVMNSFDPTDNISQFGHILGGICGGVFGFALAGEKEKSPAKEEPFDQQPPI